MSARAMGEMKIGQASSASRQMLHEGCSNEMNTNIPQSAIFLDQA